MKKLFLLFLATFVTTSGIVAQTSTTPADKPAELPAIAASPSRTDKVVIITGARFSYTLIQRLIDDYNRTNPDIQIIIESRGSNDPATYDILAEVYDRQDIAPETREYAYIARYAVLPVANAASEFAKVYEKNGLTTKLIKQIYFFDPLADRDKEQRIKAPFTVYTRLQKAGVPIIFSAKFGFTQSDINGKTIAGSDEHLMKVLTRDSTAVSYLPLPLVYDLKARTPVAGLTVLPVDLDNNDRVSDQEKFYATLDDVIARLKTVNPDKTDNLAFGDLHLSVEKKNANPNALAFLEWVRANAGAYLTEYGFLPPGGGTLGRSAGSGSSSAR
jgi:ABC-type phosphate transport system substrate-binding protein